MNKDDYIREIDSLKAGDDLREKIMAIETVHKKNKMPTYKKVIAIAACFLVVVGIATAAYVGGMNNLKDFELNEPLLYEDGDMNGIDPGSEEKHTDITDVSQRKLVKNAIINIETKDYEEFTTQLNKKISSISGYIEKSNEDVYSSNLRYAKIEVRLPAEDFDVFLSEIEKLGSIVSKQVNTSDITDSYIDTQSRIKALETEQKILLELMEKADNLSEIIQLRDRISEVTANLESYKNKIKEYDSQVEYSSIEINVDEVERVSNKGEDSFFAQIKSRFFDSAYTLGRALRSTAIFILGSLPYIGLIAAVGVVVLIIIKVRRKRQ